MNLLFVLHVVFACLEKVHVLQEYAFLHFIFYISQKFYQQITSRYLPLLILHNNIMIMFHTVLSFCSMLARDFSFAISGKFVQYWRGSCSNRMFRQHCTEFFPVPCCLESLGQHCTRVLPVECCLKSIKTALNRIFSCELLSCAFRATLHKDFAVTCAMLS